MKCCLPSFSLFLICLLLVSSCSSNANRYTPVFHTRPRISTLGFSVSPPPGTNWYEKVSSESLYFLKKLKPKDYFIYTRAIELHFPRKFNGSEDFLKYVKEKKEFNTAPEQFRNVSFSFKPINKDGLCVGYSQEYEDHGKAELSKTRDFFAKVRSRGLICVHPYRHDIGIDIYYLERMIPGTLSQSYASEGEQFIASLSFQKL